MTTAITDPTQLPYRVLEPSDDWTPSRDISDYSVNDAVAVFSRGRIRAAIVAKVGRSNIVARYTTQGAWDTATKTHAYHAHLDPEAVAFREAEVAGRTWDYKRLSTTDANVEAQVAKWPTLGREYHEKHQNEALTWLAANPSRRRFASDAYDRAFAHATEQRQKALDGGVAQYVNVTEKTVKIGDILGHWPTIEKEAR